MMELHRKAVDYALERIKESELLKYTYKVILFGSCARGEERPKSDVDILLLLNDEVQSVPDHMRLIHKLKSVIEPEDWHYPDVDLKIYLRDSYNKADKDIFFKTIRKDGVQLWPN